MNIYNKMNIDDNYYQQDKHHQQQQQDNNQQRFSFSYEREGSYLKDWKQMGKQGETDLGKG
jgi:hypothetical protein